MGDMGEGGGGARARGQEVKGRTEEGGGRGGGRDRERGHAAQTMHALPRLAESPYGKYRISVQKYRISVQKYQNLRIKVSESPYGKYQNLRTKVSEFPYKPIILYISVQKYQNIRANSIRTRMSWCTTMFCFNLCVWPGS